MSIVDLWKGYQEGVAHGVLSETARTPDELLYVSLVALAAQDRDAALTHLRSALAAAPERQVLRECAHYLERATGDADTTDVYISPDAFSAFARGGGNVGLYQRTHAALRARYAALRPTSLLDVGTGEGLALLPALPDTIGRVDVLEPSAPRLDVVRSELARRGVHHRAINTTIEDFVAAGEADPDNTWDLVQETFAMLAVPAPERVPALRWLRPLTKRVILVEFDVPRVGHALHPDWFNYVVTRYEVGLAEYPGDHNLVRQGFLVPVFLGTLRPTEDRVHFEQPVEDWLHDLRAAGFEAAREPEFLAEYWWGDAFLIEAR